MTCLRQKSTLVLWNLAVAWLLVVQSIWSLNTALAAEAGPVAHAGYFVRNWGISDGLPEASVLSLLQTRDGYLWAGTWNGLTRFDGNQFRSFTVERTDGMASDLIMSLCEGRDGAVWAGAESTILKCKDGKMQSFGREAGLTNGVVVELTEDAGGTLWAAFDFSLFQRKGERFEQFPVDPAHPLGKIRKLVPERSGGLWIGSHDGLWRLLDGKLTQVPETSGWTIEALDIDSEGRLWLGVKGRGMVTFKNGAFQHVPGTEVYDIESIYAARNGDVWASVFHSASLIRLRGGNIIKLDRKAGLVGEIIQAILEDSDGNIWAGSEGGGLIQLREERIKTIAVENPSSLAITPEGRIMVSSFEPSSLFELTDAGAEQIRPLPQGLSGIHTLATGPDGLVYIGTHGHPYQLMPDKSIKTLPDIDVDVGYFFWDRKNEMWINHFESLEHRRNDGKIEQYKRREALPDGTISVVLEDREGAIWVGTRNGICRIVGGQVERISQLTDLRAQNIRALFLDSEGIVWVGALRGGLSAWKEKEHRFVTLRVEQGLVDDTVQQIVEDKSKDLWLGTDGGIMRLRRQDLRDWLAGRRSQIHGAVLAREEGLVPSNCGTGFQRSAMCTPDGRLLFCSTPIGVIAIDPQNVQTKPKPPPVYIETVSIDGRKTEFFDFQTNTNALSQIIVPPSARQVKITYAGLDLDAPSRVRYRTQLGGRDREWEDMGTRREVVFDYLPPDHYEFRVTACNSDGIWNETGARLRLTVQPQVWQTAAFKGGVVLLIMAAAWGWYRARLRRVERQREAQEAFSRRLIDAQEAERKRVAGELHDSLGQNLLVVKNLALLGINTHDANPDTAQQFNEISEAATQALSEVRSISRSLRPAEIDRLGITKAIGAMLDRLANVSPLKLSVTLEPVDRLLPPEFEINLYRIIQEATNNILKHSQAASARINLRRDEGKIRLEIRDDGRGFDTEQAFSDSGRARGFGLSGMEERARMMGGRLAVASKPGSGTILVFTFPVKTDGDKKTQISSASP